MCGVHRFTQAKGVFVLVLIGMATMGLESRSKSPVQESIRFGLVASITGDLKPWDEESVRGAQLAIEEFNANGGASGRKVDLIIADGESRPEAAKAAAEKLISEDKVVLLLGEIASGLTMQMAQAATPAGIPLISIGATRTSLNDGRPNLFRVCYTDSFQGPVMAKFAFEELKFRRIGIVTDKKQPFSTGLSDGFRDSFTKLGGHIVDEQFYETGDTEFHGQIANLKSRRPDGVFLSGYFNETGPFARQARESGLNVKLMGGDGWDGSEILRSGGDAILNNYFCTHYNNRENRPVVKQFLAKWAKKYGGEPSTSMGALAYDGAMLACNAITRAATIDAAGLQNAIEDTVGFQGVTGTITLKGRNGNPPKRAVIVKITKNGQEFVKAYEADEKTGLPK